MPILLLILWLTQSQMNGHFNELFLIVSSFLFSFLYHDKRISFPSISKKKNPGIKHKMVNGADEAKISLPFDSILSSFWLIENKK